MTAQFEAKIVGILIELACFGSSPQLSIRKYQGFSMMSYLKLTVPFNFVFVILHNSVTDKNMELQVDRKSFLLNYGISGGTNGSLV